MANERIQRRLATILAGDVVGYSALMERAEEATSLPSIHEVHGVDTWCGESGMFWIDKPPVRWVLSWSGGRFFCISK
jgi:hypothetical protein